MRFYIDRNKELFVVARATFCEREIDESCEQDYKRRRRCKGIIHFVVVENERDDGDDDDIFFFARCIVLCTNRCKGCSRARRECKVCAEISRSSSSNDDSTSDRVDGNTTTTCERERGDGARMARCFRKSTTARGSSLSSSPTVATPATAAKKTLGRMSLKSNECNKTGASPSPRRVTPSPVSSGGPGSVERAASPPASSSNNNFREVKEESVVGAPRRIQPSLLSGSSNSSNSNTFTNRLEVATAATVVASATTTKSTTRIQPTLQEATTTTTTTTTTTLTTKRQSKLLNIS